MSDISGWAGGRGTLSEVIAARGGLAAPEAPFVIEHREALIYMLCEAAELEHAIMCQYLFAAFSLKPSTEEGLTAEQLEAVKRWRRLVAHVATEEMLHLSLVHNLLSAVGAAPHLGRPNMPVPARHYPPGVNLTLVPFGDAALRHFMFLERPEGMELKGAEAIDAPAKDAIPLMAEGDIVPRLQDFATVGHLYRSIEHGIARLAEKLGERALFVGPARAQATTAHFRWPELVAVTDVASAQRALDTILEQGEGARGDWQHAHFGQFVQILDEYTQMREADPDFDPVRPVLFATVRRCEHADNVPLIGDPLTARCTDLFNVGYEVLLQTFERYFAHTEETDPQLGTLADATLGLMLRVLRPLGELITTLPVGPEHRGMTAGPSFELFYESDYLMPHREAAWALLEERLRDAAEFCERIQADADESLEERLAPVGRALREIAGSLAAHFPDWGAVSRHTEPPAEPETADRAGLEPLRSRAAQLANAVTGAEPADEEISKLTALFGDAHQALLATATEPPGSSPSSVDPARLGPVAGRLVESVLRPLAEAVTGRPSEQTGREGEALPDASGVADGQPTTSVQERLWSLAQTATQLRAAWGENGPRAELLAEAAACVQDLAIELASGDGPSSAEERLAQLRELQSELAPAIQASANGPYLVTNVENLTNWLGERLPVRPQMALCRCGRSQLKPFCDGTHAEIGFTAEKDPKRVQDRRDTYVGQQVTVMDNRGICQHSGFCTDRLATAFHLGEEPFVTPSGGRMDEIIRAVRDCPSGALSYGIDGVEARDDVDYHDKREAAIQVSRDGPYRVSGRIALVDGDGQDEPRNEGASREHYALCRCGQSQNKPFCSGMHWYVDFKDPASKAEPTIFEWAGGLPALTRMTRVFYEKYVPQDPLLAPLFSNMSADHPERVAKWLGEVFCGPKEYSEQYGGYERMISQHLGKGLTEEKRARWVQLLLQSAQEAGLPNDAEWRSAFGAYIEWGSRLAVENSQAGAKPPEHMPMPHWDWSTAAGRPGGRISALAPISEEEEPVVVLPAADEPVRFEKHIKPLFRQRDQQSMKFVFDLWAYDDVNHNAHAILERLRNGSMPCDGAWEPEKVDVFERWVSTGMGQ